MTELWGPWRAMSRLVSSNQRESNMQLAVLNRATMRVADTTEVSGRVTADEVNLHLKQQEIAVEESPPEPSAQFPLQAWHSLREG
jgi:predicted component of type VI protein secretion system